MVRFTSSLVVICVSALIILWYLQCHFLPCVSLSSCVFHVPGLPLFVCVPFPSCHSPGPCLPDTCLQSAHHLSDISTPALSHSLQGSSACLVQHQPVHVAHPRPPIMPGLPSAIDPQASASASHLLPSNPLHSL